MAVCPMGAISMVEGVASIDNDKCITCGRCVGKCYFDALNTGTSGFRVYIGGRWGKEIQHGRMLSSTFDESQLYDVVEMLILLFRAYGETGERFASTVNRLGMEFFDAQIASKEILSRKADLISTPHHGE